LKGQENQGVVKPGRHPLIDRFSRNIRLVPPYGGKPPPRHPEQWSLFSDL
jgi:hypothetical protein